MASALAAPLVHDGDGPAAISLVAERAGVEADTLQPVSLAELRDRPPVLVAGGLAEGCDAAPGRELAEALTSAEGSLLYGHFDEAERAVLDARRAVLCGAQGVPTQTLARIELIAGLIAQERGDEPAARARYQAAVGYDPEVPWPSAYPAERRRLLDEARSSRPSATTALTVRPLLPEVSFDGQPLPAGPGPAQVPIGEHIVRLGAVAVRIGLDEAPNRLVVPRAYPETALAWAADEARRAELSALLAATLGEGTETWLVQGGTAWRGLAGRTDWTAFSASLPPPAPVVPAPLPVPERKRRWGVTLSGGATALLGGLAVAAGNALVKSAIEGAEEAVREASREDYDRMKGRYSAGLVTMGTGWTLLGVGAGLGGLGLIVGAPR